MRKVIFNLARVFFLSGVVLFYGCENSLNTELDEAQEKNGQPLPVAVATATPTVVNDGLQAVDISGITASNYVTAGTGTHSQNEETISVNVPLGATVERVFLYWARRGDEFSPDPATIKVNGTGFTGSLIGGPVDSPTNENVGVTYRLDLTGEGIVGVGNSTFTVQDDGLSSSTETLGASVLVFYSLTGEQSDLILFDGVDFIYAFYKDRSGITPDQQMALGTAEPVTFTFDPASVERTAELTLFIGDIEPEDADDRPNSLKITIGDDPTQIIGPPASSTFPFQAFQGAQWDNYVESITIPAGVGKVTVEPVSGPPDNSRAASLIWSLAGLSVPIPQENGGGQGCTPGYWRQSHHFDSWVIYDPTDILDDPFDVPSSLNLAKPERGKAENLLLKDAIKLRGGKVNALIRHAVAALLNAASPDVSYDLSVSEVISKFNAAVSGGDIEATKNEFAGFNEQGCPLN